MYNSSTLLDALLAATKPTQVYQILRDIGDHSGLTVGQEFGSEKYAWAFYGGSESNLATVHLGSKPGRALVERITNALDAVLEARMHLGGTIPQSPMDAAKTWFSRPPSTADSGLFNKWDYRTNNYDRLVQVAVTPGDIDAEPTLDIIDNGIGIQPDKFQETILSLHHGNKMTKPYLVGAYGQGGSATLRYSKYTLFVSRYIDEPQTVGFTIAKKMRLPEPYKTDAYVYLTTVNSASEPMILSVNVENILDPYPSIPQHGVSLTNSGTLVRHYGYELRNLDKRFQASQGNLYHLLQALMFDPLLPFTLFDLRQQKDSKYQHEIIRGSRNRLMIKVGKTLVDTEDEPLEAEEQSPDLNAKPTTRIRHHWPREHVSLRPDTSPNIGVEYWVVLSQRRSKDKIILRPSSELYVERNHPIVGTLNGQNQGDQTDRIFKELELPTVAKHIVVHIDATNADRDTRMELFSSDREGFAEGNVFHELMRVLFDMFKNDPALYDIENELIQDFIQRQTSVVDDEVKREITSLLRDMGLQVKDSGEALVPGEGTEKIPPSPPGHRHPVEPRPDLPTLPYPQVTRFEIVFPKTKLEIPLNGFGTIMLETDADVKFDREQRIAVRSEPSSLAVKTTSGLRGGRIKWRLQPVEGVVIGQTGEVVASITIPPGNTQIEAKLPYEVTPPIEVTGKKAKGQVPPFRIVPLDPATQRDDFDRVWTNIKSEDEIPDLAYRTMRASGIIVVYYSTAFEPFKRQMVSLQHRPELSQLFERNYKIWIGYHAILQEIEKEIEPDLEPAPDPGERNRIEVYLEQFKEQIEERERALVAEMQVKQALKNAERDVELLKRRE